MHDFLIRGATVVDGSRKSPFAADVAIQHDRIAAIGQLTTTEAQTVIEAEGCVIAPGFVDVHNHSDGWLLREPLQAAKLLQGFTSEVLMLDGIGYAPVNEATWRDWFFYLRSLDGLRMDEYEGWTSAESFMQRLDRRSGQNVLMHVPYANVRSLVAGFGSQPLDDFQMRSVRAEVRSAMEAGAVGLSTGLDYIVQCHASTDELIDVCKVVAEFDGLYATHIRYKAGLINALDEALLIARESGVALHISHLKAGAGESVERVLDWVETARRQVPLTFDVYPYMPGSTMLNFLLPYEVWADGPIAAMGRLASPEIRRRFRHGLEQYKLQLDRIRIAWLPGRENSIHQGKLLSDFVQESGRAPEDALADLLIEERLAVLCVYLDADDQNIYPFLQHDLYMMGSDGIFAEGGLIHPRQFGSASRLLGPCVNQHRLFPIEDAVYKLSTHAAQRFGLKDRGVVKAGAFADLVIFDPASVKDTATYDQPAQTAAGMRYVFVNGKPVVHDGKVMSYTSGDVLPGRFLRYER